MSDSKTVLDENEAHDSAVYEQGYECGQRQGILLGFLIALFLLGGSLLL